MPAWVYQDSQAASTNVDATAPAPNTLITLCSNGRGEQRQQIMVHEYCSALSTQENVRRLEYTDYSSL